MGRRSVNPQHPSGEAKALSTGNTATGHTAASNLVMHARLHYTRGVLDSSSGDEGSQHVEKTALLERLKATTLLTRGPSGSQVLQSSRILGQFVRRVGPQAPPPESLSQ